MPAAEAGELGLAASGTCLTGGQVMYLASDGVGPGRVLTSHDRGQTWTVADSPISCADVIRGR